MAVRSIVTTRPDVACDVCGRRLLRGEQADVFLAGGERRLVCELCAPRATHVGWLREADAHSLSARPVRRRSAKTLLGRLRQLREGGGPRGLQSAELPLQQAETLFQDDPAAHGSLEQSSLEQGSLEYAGALGGGVDEGTVGESAPQEAPSAGSPAPTSGDLKVGIALEIFNASELPVRISGVGRALGEPVVTAIPVGDAGGIVAIVTAWELCWYRYEVDVGEGSAPPRLVAQGTELDELAPEELAGGIRVDERGELVVELA